MSDVLAHPECLSIRGENPSLDRKINTIPAGSIRLIKPGAGREKSFSEVDNFIPWD